MLELLAGGDAVRAHVQKALGPEPSSSPRRVGSRRGRVSAPRVFGYIPTFGATGRVERRRVESAAHRPCSEAAGR